MILNKSSMERGLAHGTIIKCENVNLRVKLLSAQNPRLRESIPSTKFLAAERRELLRLSHPHTRRGRFTSQTCSMPPALKTRVHCCCTLYRRSHRS